MTDLSIVFYYDIQGIYNIKRETFNLRNRPGFDIGNVLRRNLREVIFVFLAFSLMASAAYFSVGYILRGRLLDRAQEMISVAETNIRAGLSETETILLSANYLVRGMIERNASRQEILDYLANTTGWMREHNFGLLNYYGIYGFINGEFYDSIGLNPGDDYIPQTRLWYQTAERSGADVSYSAPYIDFHTGDTVVSAVQNIFTKGEDRIAGILTVDFSINWLTEYVSSFAMAPGGYGILINQNMTLMAHPNHEYTGLQLEQLGGSYDEITRILRGGGKVLARRIEDNGKSAIVFFTQIFNGWYVGIVTPYHQFYGDLYITALILILLGLVLSLSLCYMLLRLSAAKMRADKESKNKSSFLASMSHEIRTPMNAITSMTELLLRGELTDEARSYALDIKQAGSNLISVINDILDISKIEAGKLDIVPAKYMFLSLINDTVNIIRMRIGEKPIRFFTNVDNNIPAVLFGDEARLRQMLLNLLSNAEKYSEKGHFGLIVTIDKQDEKNVWLKFTITDTGKGIKLEDQAKLFGEFVQVDLKKNRGIEGTGLGLAITRRLCAAMGGNIALESEYGRGSTFTMIIPQGIEAALPFAAVKDPEKKKVLIYERRNVYTKSISWSLENMRVPCTIVSTLEDFSTALYSAEWLFVFSGIGLYEKIKPLIENGDFHGKKKPSMVLMAEWGTEAFIPNARLLSLPAHSLSIANVLNSKADSKGYIERAGTKKYTYPSARLLIVDDLNSNLKVAKALLLPFKTTVDTCLSGAKAIDFIKHHVYDLAFIDHLMPDMDGIETVANIRAWEKENSRSQMPVVALTANAVAGVREMFLENGFNDFLAKPIDVSKLNEILDRWIPQEKRGQETNSAAQMQDGSHNLILIPGIDSAKGITRTGGTLENYISVLSLFRSDAEERLRYLQTAPDEDALRAFTTHVHSLKSAVAIIGGDAVSAKAAELEAAARDADIASIANNLSGFTSDLAELIENIKKALTLYNKSLQQGTGENMSSAVKPLLLELKEALAAKKATSDIFGILDRLEQLHLDVKIKDALDKISYHVLMNEFDKAIKIIEEYS